MVYSTGKTLWKAVVAFIEALLGVSSGILMIEPPESLEDLRRTWPAFVVAVILAILRGWRNYAKQHPRVKESAK